MVDPVSIEVLQLQLPTATNSELMDWFIEAMDRDLLRLNDKEIKLIEDEIMKRMSSYHQNISKIEIKGS
jgi:hypothetical protein